MSRRFYTVLTGLTLIALILVLKPFQTHFDHSSHPILTSKVSRKQPSSDMRQATVTAVVDTPATASAVDPVAMTAILRKQSATQVELGKKMDAALTKMKAYQLQIDKIHDAKMKMSRILSGPNADEFIRRHHDEIEKINQKELILAQQRNAELSELSTFAEQKK